MIVTVSLPGVYISSITIKISKLCQIFLRVKAQSVNAVTQVLSTDEL